MNLHTNLPNAHRTRLSSALVVAAACMVSTATSAAARIDRLEPVADDALGRDTRLVPNAWGGHQLRMTRHADGSSRALYLHRTDSGTLGWRVMRRSAAGRWTEEVSGTSTDDVNLLRDPATDRAVVLAWPGSVPTTYTSPDWRAQRVDGQWAALGDGSRHYAATGISPNGHLCLKATVERGGTGRTSVSYACGRWRKDRWDWGDQEDLDVGPRLAYDYLFPSNEGDEITSVAQLDVHRDVVQRPGLDQPWVFNGVRAVRAPVGGGREARREDLAGPVPIHREARRAPVQRQSDALIDTRGRLVSLQYVQDTEGQLPAGFHASVGPADGSEPARRTHLDELPTYGQLRVYEDARRRLWLLWTNRGSRHSQVRLFPVRIEAGGRLAVGGSQDLGDALGDEAIDGAPYLVVPRGGNPRLPSIEGLLAVCETPYQPGQDYRSESCYSSPRSQRVMHFRIRLPD